MGYRFTPGGDSLKVRSCLLVSIHADGEIIRASKLTVKHHADRAHALLFNHFSVVRRCGNKITSRMVSQFVINIVKRSTPMPKPPLGGMP